MGVALRRTLALLAVVRCFMSRRDPIWGLQLTKELGLPSGTVYPLLERLEREGFVVSQWDSEQARGPRRRLYSITEEGRSWAGSRLPIEDPMGGVDR